MASEASSNNQTDDRIVEEEKEVNIIKDTDGQNVSQPKKVEGKNEEANFQVENLTNAETSLTGSEGKPEGKSDSTVEVKKEEEDNDKAEGSDDSVGHGVEEVDNAKKEAETSAASEPAVEDSGEELKNQSDVSNTPVPQSEVVEKPKEDFEASSVQESESEASKRQAVSETVTENVKGKVTEPSTVPSSISEEENKQEEPPIASIAKAPASDGIETLGTEEGAKVSQDEKKNFEETVALENLSAVVTDVARLQEAGKGAVAFEATNAPQKSDTDLNASRDVEESAKEEMGSSKVEEVVEEVAVDAGKPDPSAAIKLVEAADESSVIKIMEDSMKPDSKVEEQKQEKITEAEEPNLSEKSKIDTASEVAYEGEKVSGGTEKVEEKKNERLESIEPSLLETSKDLKEATGVPEVMGSSKTEGVVEKVAVDAGKPDPSAAIELVEAADESSVVKITKDSMKPDTKVEEQKQERITEAEEPNLSEKSKIDAASEFAEVAYEGVKVSGSTEKIEEKKNERLESNEPTLLETSKKLKEATGVPEVMGSSKVKEVLEEVAVDAGKPDPSAALELVEAADESSVIKITEDSMKPDAKVEERKQEKITEAEEPNLSEKSKIDTASEVAEVAYEGEKVSGSTEKVEEKKNERLESIEPTLLETSKDLKEATGVSEVSSEKRKVSEGADIVEDKDEHLKSKEEITRDLDAASIVAEASSQEEKTSKGAAMFEEKKDEGLKDEKVSGLETKDFEAASEVAEFSSQEKVSGILEIVAEKDEESLETDKTTSIGTMESSDAAAVSSKDEKSSIAVEMVDKKDNSLEGDKPTLVATSKDFDVVTDVSGVSLVEEKTSGGTEMVQEKDEKEKSPEGTDETINEKRNEALEGGRKTLGETFKEHDMEEKNVIAASATEPVADSEEIEKDKELAKDIAETGKPDDRNLVESSKDGDVTKQDEEVPKQAVHKTSKHHSSNILSKMKHLIVKAKKAILGKSPSSKTISVGTKDDIKVK